MSDRIYKKKLKIFILHFTVLAALSALVAYGCVFFNLFGIICPACGCTRAWLSFFRGELDAAFRYNFFFPLIPLYIFLFIHRDTKLLERYKRKIDVFLYAFTVILLFFNIYRVYFNRNLEIFPNGFI